MLRLSWFLAEGGHGYATVGAKLKEAVTKAGAQSLELHRIDWDAIIAVHPPTKGYIVGPRPRPDVVFHTMVEANRLPALWRDMVNRVGLVWVPSKFCEDVFRTGGVTVPIMRTGYAVEGTPVRRQNHDGPFRVLAWGDSLASRKNILLAIQVFIDANLPNSELEVKLNLGDFPIPDLMWTDSNNIDHPNIHIYHGNWEKDRLTNWLHSGDVGIYLSGGEGYGLMPKEMMATGLPMISVINTGMHEYLRHTDVLYVPSDKMVPSPFFNRSYRETGFEMHTPDMEAAVAHLRWAYGNREALYDLGMRGSTSALKDTWDLIGQEAYNKLRTHFR